MGALYQQAGHDIHLARSSALDPGLHTCVFAQHSRFPVSQTAQKKKVWPQKKNSTTTGFEPVQAEPN